MALLVRFFKFKINFVVSSVADVTGFLLYRSLPAV